MTSRKARRFRAIFARNFLKIHTFFHEILIFSELSCEQKNLKWIFISYGIYETRWLFYIPSPKARGYETHNSFHKYRMKWKFISDPIYMKWMSFCCLTNIYWSNRFCCLTNVYWSNSKMTSILYDYIREYMTKWKQCLAWYDVAINSTMHTCILLDKF